MLTQEYLKSILHYSPCTGDFTWTVNKSPNTYIGMRAGTLDDGYIRIFIDKKSYRSSRLAHLYITGEWPQYEIDHINHIRSDNRWENLRSVSSTENLRNKTLYRNNNSNLPGVIWHTRDLVWQSRINNNGKRAHLGYFDDFFDACCARKSAENKYRYHPNHGATKFKDQLREIVNA